MRTVEINSHLVVLGSQNLTRFSVNRREVIEVIGSVPFSIQTCEGQVWLTHDRSQRDDVLGAGQRIDLAADRRVFLTGLPTATVSLMTQTLRGDA